MAPPPREHRAHVDQGHDRPQEREPLARVDDDRRADEHSRSPSPCRTCEPSDDHRASIEADGIEPGSRRTNRQNGTVAAVPPRLERFFEPDSPTQQLAARLAAAGFAAYLVGGSVRDALLDRAITDVDITTDGATRRDRGRGYGLGRCGVAARPAVRHDRLREGRRAVRDHDVSRRRVPPRQPQARGHLLRRHRDRSVPARLHRQRDGDRARRSRADRPVRRASPILPARRLRTPLSPEISFTDDPLRMLRAARFSATLGFAPDADVVEAMESMRDRLEIVERGTHP